MTFILIHILGQQLADIWTLLKIGRHIARICGWIETFQTYRPSNGAGTWSTRALNLLKEKWAAKLQNVDSLSARKILILVSYMIDRPIDYLLYSWCRKLLFPFIAKIGTEKLVERLNFQSDLTNKFNIEQISHFKD